MLKQCWWGFMMFERIVMSLHDYFVCLVLCLTIKYYIFKTSLMWKCWSYKTKLMTKYGKKNDQMYSWKLKNKSTFIRFKCMDILKFEEDKQLKWLNFMMIFISFHNYSSICILVNITLEAFYVKMKFEYVETWDTSIYITCFS